jgi:predicted negative regulator of RcsB-dependent stress response
MAVSPRAFTLIAGVILGVGAVAAWQYVSVRSSSGGAEPGFREATTQVCNRANVGKIRLNPQTGHVELCH